MTPATPNIGIISQARMTSTRLPGKVLQPIAGKPLLHYHVQRLRQSGLPLYLATTTNWEDDRLADFAAANGIPCTRGDEHDVLGRYRQCAQEHGLDIIVRVTSDCPLIDGPLVASCVREYVRLANPYLYLSNALQRTYPRGFDFEIFSRQLLEEAFQRATLPADREHVTPYINQNRSGQVHFRHSSRVPNRSHYRLTVDTAEDFELIKVLIEQYGADKLDANELIQLLDEHPELVALNAHVEQKKV